MPIEISVQCADIATVPADLLLLKYAQNFYGADQAIAARLAEKGVCREADISPSNGEYALIESSAAIAATRTIFLGTPRLREFRYREMTQFARRAIEIIGAKRLPVRRLTTTVHGAGYGLDVAEALRSMIFGFQQGLAASPLPQLEKILFVERNSRRCELLQTLLEGVEIVTAPHAATPGQPASAAATATLTVGDTPAAEPARRKSVFVAMPFVEECEDVYQFGIYSTIRRCGYICEKVDESVFAGSIVDRIMDGIRNAEFIIADLTMERPNVYLEVGYAWGMKKPVLLVAREGQRLHFDLSHHKCLFYKTIGKLAESLEKAVLEMFAGGAMATDATDQRELHPSFAAALRADRESLNSRFSAKQRAGARIDESAFQEHLRTTVNDLLRDVASVQPERVRAVAGSLFDVSLDLFAANLLGPEIKHPHVSAAWHEVLPRATRLLARDPTRIAGCLSNAADYLATQPESRPAEWIQFMRDLSPHFESVQQWLDAGKIAAWRAGLVQFRAPALGLARQLPLKLAARSMGAPDDILEPAWREQLDRLEADRWMPPNAEAGGASQFLSIVRTTGGFRGFGGPCLRPPTVSAQDGELFVSDGNSVWQLRADVFGTLWHRVPGHPAKTAASASALKCTIDFQGRVDWDGGQQIFAELTESSSNACDGQTLAVTLATSHHVFLVARTAKQPG